jgi:hypothetical protein
VIHLGCIKCVTYIGHFSLFILGISHYFGNYVKNHTNCDLNFKVSSKLVNYSVCSRIRKAGEIFVEKWEFITFIDFFLRCKPPPSSENKGGGFAKIWVNAPITPPRIDTGTVSPRIMKYMLAIKWHDLCLYMLLGQNWLENLH